MRYNTVIFDMDGVILNSLVNNEEWKYNAVKSALAEIGLNPGEFSIAQYDAFLGDQGRQATIDICKKNNVDPEVIWKVIAKKTSESRLQMIKKGEFRLYSDALHILNKLKSSRSKLGVISNAPESAVKMTVDYFELRNIFDYFRGVEDFEDLKLRKPSGNHIKIAMAELKQDPFLYVGDSKVDIEAAKEAGIDSALVSRTGKKPSYGQDYTLDSIGDLEEKIEI